MTHASFAHRLIRSLSHSRECARVSLLPSRRGSLTWRLSYRVIKLRGRQSCRYRRGACFSFTSEEWWSPDRWCILNGRPSIRFTDSPRARSRLLGEKREFLYLFIIIPSSIHAVQFADFYQWLHWCREHRELLRAFQAPTKRVLFCSVPRGTPHKSVMLLERERIF